MSARPTPPPHTVPTQRDALIEAAALNRGIEDVLHFTTNCGLTGIAATNRVLARAYLDENEDVPFVYKPNCADRYKDLDWITYVNLSITAVNKRMLGTSDNWHRHEDLWWLVLAFDPVILGHPGVQFVSTNNTYSATLRRAPGVAGFEDMFSARVPWGYHGSVHTRRPNMPANLTTDPQAEFLYPNAVPLEHLKAIYVPQPELADEVHMLMNIFPHFPTVEVSHRPEVFT